MNTRTKIILLILVIIAILAVVFFSQQSYARAMIKSFISYIDSNAGAYLLGGFKKGSVKDNASAPSTNSNPYQLDGSTSANTDSAEPVKWTISDIPKMLGDKVKSGGETIANSVATTKEKISENISSAEKNIENYFSGIGNSILHPGTETSQNCVPVQGPPAAPTN